MSIEIKLKPEELALVDIIRHPVLGSEFIRNFDMLPEEREGYESIWKRYEENEQNYYIHTQYQKEMVCDFNQFVVFCTARAVGKTESLIDKITFYMVNQFWNDEYYGFFAPNRVHVDPVFRKLRRWFKNNGFLKYLVDRNSINASNLTIRLKTGSFLDCRIAGTTGTGANVVGIHTPVVLLDEAAYFPWGTWQELQRSFNEWMPGAQMVVAGVPDGRRENSVLFHVDQKDPMFTKHRVASAQNPRWTEEAEIRAVEQFGGERSEDYVHMVLGEHGSPVWSVFDRALMRVDDLEVVYKELSNADIKEDSQAGYRQIIELPPIPKNAEQVLFGIDLGYTEPTAIIIMYLSNDTWFPKARLNWYQIPYDKQEQMISFLANKYNPSLIGMDEGSAGKAVVQHLLTGNFNFKNFPEVLIPINFAQTLPIGVDEDGNEIKERAKEFGMQLLQELVNTHKIAFSSKDEELIVELERTTYTKSPSGRLTFRTYTERGGLRGGDHNLAALLSGFLAWYLRYSSGISNVVKPKLFKARWIL